MEKRARENESTVDAGSLNQSGEAGQNRVDDAGFERRRTWKSAADVPALVYALEKRRKRAKIEGIVAFLVFLTIGAVMFEMMDPALREKALENCLVVVPGCMALQILMARAKKKKETKTNGAADASGETPKAEDDDAWGCAIFLFLLAALALITLIADARDATYSVEVKLR